METVLNILQNVKSDLYTHAKENKTQNRGTTTWHAMEGSKLDEYGPIISEIPSTSGRFFLQPQDNA